jgi:beta-apo-4'-carotenal oxygenase
MAASTIPAFEHTSMDKIAPTCATARKAFLSHKTRDLEYRKVQLRKLYWAFKDNSDLIEEACKKDLGKSQFETYLTEISWVMNDCIFMANNLDRFAKDEKPADIAFTNKFMGPRIRKDPLGAVLIIGAYNFPIQLTIGPLIGAIAAGCTAVIKPSESAPYAASVMQKIMAESLDPDCYTCIQGAVPETTALLDEKWDKIFYTGSEMVAKIIAKKAAETLTPLTLELGGKNPAIITKHADPKLAAKRLLWAKMLNAGQVCVSQNCTFIDREILPAFIQEMKNSLNEFYPKGPRNSPDYGRIVNQRQFLRLKKMLDSSNGKIVIGGTMDEADLFIEPTVVQVESIDDSLVRDESFGPLLPILPVTDLDEAIRLANEVHDTPLGTYAFGTKAEMNKSRHRPPPLHPHTANTRSPRPNPLRRRLPQRRLLPRLDPHPGLRRRRLLGPGRLPRQSLLRHLHSPPQRDHHPGVDREPDGRALPAVHGRQAQEVLRHERDEAQLRPPGQGYWVGRVVLGVAGVEGAGGADW